MNSEKVHRNEPELTT